MSGIESPEKWLMVLVIALIVLGPSRLPEVGRSLGQGIRGFRQGIAGLDQPHDRPPPPER